MAIRLKFDLAIGILLLAGILAIVLRVVGESYTVIALFPFLYYAVFLFGMLAVSAYEHHYDWSFNNIVVGIFAQFIIAFVAVFTLAVSLNLSEYILFVPVVSNISVLIVDVLLYRLRDRITFV